LPRPASKTTSARRNCDGRSATSGTSRKSCTNAMIAVARRRVKSCSCYRPTPICERSGARNLPCGGERSSLGGLGISDLDKKPRSQEIGIVKPDPPLRTEDIVDLELQPQSPGAGAPIRMRGAMLNISVPGMYWALGRMFRASVVDQSGRREQEAQRFLGALPVPPAVVRPEAGFAHLWPRPTQSMCTNLSFGLIR
jgi:hypothetical protein